MLAKGNSRDGQEKIGVRLRPKAYLNEDCSTTHDVVSRLRGGTITICAAVNAQISVQDNIGATKKAWIIEWF